ncbi:unnamed protein product, partial [Prunus brigantina]
PSSLSTVFFPTLCLLSATPHVFPSPSPPTSAFIVFIVNESKEFLLSKDSKPINKIWSNSTILSLKTPLKLKKMDNLRKFHFLLF